MLLICMIILGVIFYIYYFEGNKYQEINNGQEQLRCYNCGQIVEEDHNYCPNCREKLKDKCGNCGKMIGVNWRYCPYCNKPNLDGRWGNEV